MKSLHSADGCCTPDGIYVPTQELTLTFITLMTEHPSTDQGGTNTWIGWIPPDCAVEYKELNHVENKMSVGRQKGSL